MKPWYQRYALSFLFFFVLYMYIVFISYSYNFDGTVFSQFLRSAVLTGNLEPILSPHHLLYLPFAYISYKFLSSLFVYHMLEYFHLQLISLSFALLTLLVINQILKALNIREFYRLAGLLLTAFSFLFWVSAIETEVHMPGIFFMVSGIYFLFFKENRFKNLVIAALLFALSAGFHLTNGLIVFSIAAYFLLSRGGIKKPVQFFASYGFFLALPYLWLTITTGLNLVEWARDTLLGKSVFTGYTYTGTQFSRWRRFGLHSLSDSAGAVKNSLVKADSGLLGVLSALVALVILAAVVYYLAKTRPQKTLLYLSAWPLPFFIFFTLWQPANYEFKLNVSVPLLILFIAAMDKFESRLPAKWILSALAVLFFAVNFWGSIKPMHRLDNNPNYAISRAIEKKTPSNATVVIAGSGAGCYLHGKIYIPYFALRKTIILDWRLGKGFSFDQVAGEISQKLSQGETVYLLSEVATLTPTMKDLLAFHEKGEPEFRKFLERLTLGETRDLPLALQIVEVKAVRPAPAQ